MRLEGGRYPNEPMPEQILQQRHALIDVDG
jgi:hypothetical protein